MKRMSEIIESVEVEAAFVVRFGYEEFTLNKETAEDLYSQLGSYLNRG